MLCDRLDIPSLEEAEEEELLELPNGEDAACVT